MRATLATALLALLFGVPQLLEAATPYPQQQGQQQQQRQLLAEGNKPASLTVAGPDCIEAFYNTTAAHYADDDTCSFMINQAFAATAQSGCPQGGTGDASPTQKCIQKTEGATAAWVSYLTKCPLANVLTGGKGFSCFKHMSSPADFEAYANGTAAAQQPAARSSSTCVRPACSGAWLLCVAVGLFGAVVLL